MQQTIILKQILRKLYCKTVDCFCLAKDKNPVVEFFNAVPLKFYKSEFIQFLGDPYALIKTRENIKQCIEMQPIRLFTSKLAFIYKPVKKAAAKLLGILLRISVGTPPYPD